MSEEKYLNSRYRTHIQHYKSNGQKTGDDEVSQYYDGGLSPKLPDVQDLLLGEIALNVAPGTETIAIRNYRGEIVYIPFNVAKKIKAVGQQANDNTRAINDTNDRITVLSGETLVRFERIQDVIEALDGTVTSLSSKTDENIERIDGNISELSSFTHTSINIIGGVLDSHTEALDNIGEQIEQISQNIVEGTNERLEELSATTMSAISANTLEHQAINGKIDVVSGNLRTDLNSVSGIAENALEVAQTASQEVGMLTDYVNDEIARVESGVTDVDAKVDSLSGNVGNTITRMSNELGFYDNGNGNGYHPTSENLRNFNVTQSLDYINEKLNDDILSGETRYLEIIKIILEDEKVTANFAATINASCGFDIHAKYLPTVAILQGLNVTQAIDAVYNQVENDLESGLTSVKEEINIDVDGKLEKLRSGLTEVIVSGDTELHERIDEIEQWFIDSSKQPLERTVTYNELVRLYDMHLLKWGMIYRITDYQATVDTEYVDASTNHVEANNLDPYDNDGFDILVRATSNETLSEIALAMEHPRNDTNPRNHPECWEIKYSLVNDVSRFSWALDRGHGVIFYMKDQYGNEAPYDFKNIKVNGNYLFGDENGHDASNSGLYRNNVINPTYTEDHRLMLNNIHFIGADSYEGNVFSPGCKNITITGTFNNNTVSPLKNGEVLINKENTFLGFSYE